MPYTKILQKAKQTHNLTQAEVLELLANPAAANALFEAADETRLKYVGDGVYLRGLIEFSSFCRQNCNYCGLRRDNKKAVRYRLSKEQITDFASKAAGYGYKTVVLQSGEDMYFNADIMCQIIRDIKKLGLVITLSIGEKTYQEYKAYKEAGADRYLLRIETTDKTLYEVMDPGMSWDNRVRCLMDLKALGYEVGSGSLVGLPGQSLESIASDILFFKNLPVNMAGIGPFIPHPETPLAAADVKGHFELALKVMAVTRLLLPDINIPATTAMESLDPQGRLIALKSGANVVMPNVTEGDYRKFYELYPGKICVGDTPSQCRFCIEGKIESIGRHISPNTGFQGEYLREKNKNAK